MADAIVVNSNGIVVRPSDGIKFLKNEIWSSFAYFGSIGTYFADVTGDGKADAIAVNNDGVYVRVSRGSYFDTHIKLWTTSPNAYYSLAPNLYKGVFFASLLGNGKSDAIVVNPDFIYARFSTGSAFVPPAIAWTDSPFLGDKGMEFADVDGNGKADAISILSSGIIVRLNFGKGFLTLPVIMTNPYYGQIGTYFADVTGDKRADAIVVNNDGVTVRRSFANFFDDNKMWTDKPFYGNLNSMCLN